MNAQTDRSKLRHILNANAVFSATSGLIFCLAAAPLAQFLSTTPPILYVLAITLFAYAVLIVFNTSRPAINHGFTLFIILSDITWVLISILLLVTPGLNFTPTAKWAIAVMAICVDTFATLQFLQWRKMR